VSGRAELGTGRAELGTGRKERNWGQVRCKRTLQNPDPGERNWGQVRCKRTLQNPDPGESLQAGHQGDEKNSALNHRASEVPKKGMRRDGSEACEGTGLM
jgi:hypothetical protein